MKKEKKKKPQNNLEKRHIQNRVDKIQSLNKQVLQKWVLQKT